jgi:hypothetical protein
MFLLSLTRMPLKHSGPFLKVSLVWWVEDHCPVSPSILTPGKPQRTTEYETVLRQMDVNVLHMPTTAPELAKWMRWVLTRCCFCNLTFESLGFVFSISWFEPWQQQTVLFISERLILLFWEKFYSAPFEANVSIDLNSLSPAGIKVGPKKQHPAHPGCSSLQLNTKTHEPG